MSDDRTTDDGLMDQSEQLDGDELGEQVGDDYLPGLEDYPPEEAQGSEDPSLYTPDDVAVRSLRETHRDSGVEAAEEGVDLLRPDDEDSLVDDEAEELGEIGAADEGEPVAPEVSAVHVVDEPGQ
jgi:hypothetical protein